MARRVRWADRAVADLEEIASYIAEDSPAAATRVVRRLRKAALSLAELSGRGRQVLELDLPDLRELLHGDYRLIYKIEREAILILFVVHGSRDLNSLYQKWFGPN